MIPSVHAYVKLPNNVLAKCHFLHPAPPSPSENEYATPRDRALLLIAKTVQSKDEPTLVTGDLNDVAQIKRLPSIDSDHFTLFSELVFKDEATEK